MGFLRRRRDVPAVRLLGPRCAVAWKTLAEFWAAVATWRVDNRPPLESSEKATGAGVPGFSHIAAALRQAGH